MNNIKTDAGWVRDSEGKNTGDWEVVIYVVGDDEPEGRILAYPSHSYVHDVAPNIRVALRDDKLIRCECDPEDNWVHWVFRDGPGGHTSFACATPEEATKAVTLLNNLISLMQNDRRRLDEPC